MRYLQDAQNADGGFADEPGGESDPDFSAWVALALAAAGINPRIKTASSTRVGGDVYTYLAEHAGEAEAHHRFRARTVGRRGRPGTSPHDFGGSRPGRPDPGAPDHGRPEEGAFPHQSRIEATAGINDTYLRSWRSARSGNPLCRKPSSEQRVGWKHEQNWTAAGLRSVPRSAVRPAPKTAPENQEKST